jgi:hypothetical protein
MSLWTPGGEHAVPRPDPSEPAAASGGTSSGSATGPSAAAAAGAAEGAQLSEEDRSRAEAVAQEMAEVREQLASAPAAVVVANHAMGLYELGAIHLGRTPPNLPEAKIAIDAFAALVETIGDRLGPDSATLRDALAQIRLAFVQIQAGSEAGGAGDGDGEAATEASGG